ncbi:hypothetical protein M413DRAFT_445119 [Hebeloma cylindrosporum]|uniref:Uncharacterized protein n=1 Tax=Hebeloma cylindrosporum TaxID=76867 RepID=A0A0C3CE60_HEBCY|nr:hypothetical protein M413DRAFT_445119 [Hebeloma cylindrosporum h7]
MQVEDVNDEQRPHDNDQVRENGLVLRGTRAPISRAHEARRAYRGRAKQTKQRTLPSGMRVRRAR